MPSSSLSSFPSFSSPSFPFFSSLFESVIGNGGGDDDNEEGGDDGGGDGGGGGNDGDGSNNEGDVVDSTAISAGRLSFAPLAALPLEEGKEGIGIDEEGEDEE